MGLYDVFDDISQKQVLKSETGDNRIFGVVVGIVEENNNKDYPGQVCVRIPVRDEQANVLRWAKVATLMAGKTWGSYIIPEVGDEVLLAFEQGNIEKPYVIGAIPKASSSMLTQGFDEKNKRKDIYFQNGTKIQMEDDTENDGEKDRLTITTAGEKLVIQIDNEKERITLKDKGNKNSIVIKGLDDDGTIEIKAEKKIKMTAGDITFTLNGDTGTSTLETGKYTCKADKNIELSADASFKASGQNMKLDAGNMFSAESSGPAKIASSAFIIK